MIKIVLKSEAAVTVFQVLKTPLSVLLYPTVIAYAESKAAIYVADPHADLTVSRLAEAGVTMEIVKT